MTESNEQAVLYAVDGGIATITLNRPESRNALNLAMCEGLLSAARAAAADPDVRVVLVRAAGAVFCAGADLKERKTMDESQVLARRMRGFFAYEALESAADAGDRGRRRRRGRLRRRDHRGLRLRCGDARGDVLDARGAVGHGGRDATTLAHRRQAAREGHDVHWPPPRRPSRRCRRAS